MPGSSAAKQRTAVWFQSESEGFRPKRTADANSSPKADRLKTQEGLMLCLSTQTNSNVPAPSVTQEEVILTSLFWFYSVLQ